MRGAAGRRALQLALLVGGVFVLALLCGERAQAAEGVPPVKDVVGGVAGVPAAPGGPTVSRERESREPDEGGADASRGTADAAVADLRPVTDHVVRSVRDRVARPVDDLVRTVSEELEAVQAEAPPLDSLPSLPALPGIPALPGDPALPGAPPLPALPDTPALPAVPTLPDVPVSPPPSTLPDVSGPGGPVTPVSPATRPGHDTTATRPTADAEAFDAGAYGPRFAGGEVHPAAHGGTRRAVGTEYAPPRPAPAGDPDGALGNGSAADNGTPRHGDTHAVTHHHQVPLRLVPGALVRADAAEIRDRYRDIPVSPA